MDKWCFNVKIIKDTIKIRKSPVVSVDTPGQDGNHILLWSSNDVAIYYCK